MFLAMFLYTAVVLCPGSVLLVFLAMFLYTAVVLCLGSVPAGVPGRNVHGHVPGWSVWRIFQS